MFERRLKIFLAFPILCGLIIAGRLVHLQIVRGAEYAQLAEDALVSPRQYLPPLRGRILERYGSVVVSDEPAHDVTVHYGILSMSRPYLLLLADHFRKQNPHWRTLTDQAVEAEVERRIQDMWLTLERVSGVPLGQLRQRRDALCDSVERLRHHIWRLRHERGLGEPLQKLRLQEEDLFHPVLSDITPEVRTRVELALSDIPFVRVEPSVRRVWAEDTESLCHLLGRLGQASAEAINDDPLREDSLACYRAGDQVGLSGVEALGEQMLRGKRGFEEKYRDGKPKELVPPIDGLDVQLTIDLELQRRVAELLAQAVSDSPPATGASCVIIDVESREILAMVSLPTFDRERLRNRFESLRDDAKGLPLLFRAVQAEYQPGSIVKPVTLLAGMAAGLADAQRTVFCDGTFIPGSTKWHCWTHWRQLPGHGAIGAEEAIQHSCNVYFYDLGQRLGAARLTEFLRLFIQGRDPQSGVPQGTGLIEERPGLIPTLGWMKTNRHRMFRPADGRNFAIGQGEMQVTPLQAANLFATIATGAFRSPTIIANDLRPRPTLPIAGAAEGDWQLTRRGLYRCVNEVGGTGYNYARMENLKICGKTGSAQCARRVVEQRFSFLGGQDGLSELSAIAATREGACELLGLAADARPYKTEVVARWPPLDPETGKSPTHAWFAGFAPYEEPRIALAIIIEYGGSGGRTAGPVAREIFQTLIDSPRGYLSPQDQRRKP